MIIWLNDELQLAPRCQFEEYILSCDVSTFVPATHSMNPLLQYANELKKKKDLAEKHASELRQEIRTLWLRLNISDEDVSDFLSTTKGCKPSCIRALEAELCRCQELCKQNLLFTFTGHIQQYKADDHMADMAE